MRREQAMALKAGDVVVDSARVSFVFMGLTEDAHLDLIVECRAAMNGRIVLCRKRCHTERPSNPNTERAGRAEFALAKYRKLVDPHEAWLDEEIRTYMVDMLTDMLHLADREAINFLDALEMAYIHHNDEVNDENL